MNRILLDAHWRAAHPLPGHGAGTDKNSRGRVLAVGGSALVPGALRLTGEAALRAGAGKLQMATIADAAAPLGALIPEAALIGLPTDEQGDIGPGATEALSAALGRCDTLVLGPGMHAGIAAERLVTGLLGKPAGERQVVLDAGAAIAAGKTAELVRALGGRVVLTPHHGEMAAISGADVQTIAADPDAAATAAARELRAIVVLKNARTVIADPSGHLLVHESDCVGLATGGSGDVLAGIIAGLLARGAEPMTAAGWGVWLHAEAGRLAAERVGPIGFLARDLLALIPALMAE